MKKEQLIFSEQHSFMDENTKKVFTAKVYKGTTFRKTNWGNMYDRNNPWVEKVVEVKAFRIDVTEQWLYDGFEFYLDHEDFGYCTARSGEFAHALRRIKECASLDEVRMLMADLVVDFDVALQKDARRELKRQLGMRRTHSPIVRTKKEYKPLPQIKLPWEEE